MARFGETGQGRWGRRICRTVIVALFLIEAVHGLGQPVTVIDLQPFRKTTKLTLPEGSRRMRAATLINLNPYVNAWYVLTLTLADGTETSYHLENPYPKQQMLALDSQYVDGLVIASKSNRLRCALWGGSSDLFAAQKSRQPYVPLCDGRVLLRNRTAGHKTSREWATDFLRMYVPGGETITTFVRNTFYKDAFLSKSEISADAEEVRRLRPAGAPARPLIDPQYDGHLVTASDMGIAIDGADQRQMLVGRWYQATGLPGIFVSAIQPKLVAPSVIEAQKGMVKPLDDVEQSAMVYVVAFDLGLYELNFAMGTEHPRVDWSERAPPQMRDPALPGPDGIGTVDPLVNTGMIDPVYGDRVAATFTGGFKRYHGAFHRSDLAMVNHASHYGFIENGVVMSKLQPGLATALMYVDGQMDLKVWTAQDSVALTSIRHARQNGAPLIVWDAARNAPRPGGLVGLPALGNWSGAVDGRYRTLRAGIGLQEGADRRFLLYGYFSAATPSAMARIFQAYGCRCAMMTDMNALEHTYLAVYTMDHDTLVPEHLVRGMAVLDKVSQGQTIPRFVGYADNRDFFYLLRKETP